jgi:S-adenosylmethionine:tRNA ribosyltransferase-isomerase
MQTDAFDYELPPAAIAQAAVEPRDSSRLLRVETMEDFSFSALPGLLRAGDLLVVNRTRVRHGRLRGTRVGTGGAVELLLLRPLGDSWEALVRPSRRLRPGVELEFGPMKAQILTQPEDGRVEVFLSTSGDVENVLAAIGEVPLPPYFRGRLADPERYQTMFASVTGSAAAPTAALHFTPELMARLADGGVSATEVELEIGLDTFRPMGAGTIADHTIHRERYVVSAAAAAAIAGTRSAGGRVIAVGTTVLRTLETVAIEGGKVIAETGYSSLFIAPGFEPRVADALITNFHAPRTTLVVLVAALLGDRWRDTYETALDRGYRFLSFGDAMLIEGLRDR